MAKQKKQPPILIGELSAHGEIAEIQLERLRMAARERLLTYEEVKIYDLLTKNLLLTKGEATDIIGQANRLAEKQAISNDSLVEIAATMDDKLIEQSLEFVKDDDKEKPQS
jgi:hypothetical protein